MFGKKESIENLTEELQKAKKREEERRQNLASIPNRFLRAARRGLVESTAEEFDYYRGKTSEQLERKIKKITEKPQDSSSPAVGTEDKTKVE